MSIFRFSKGKFLISIITLYIILSGSFIIYVFWNSYRTSLIQEAINYGRAEIISSIILESQKSECEPFRVFNDQSEEYLINIKCLEKKEN